MTIVRYGIAGCGIHSSHHVPKIPDLELVGLCDKNVEAMEQLCRAKELGGVAKYTDYEKFLASGIDAVVITTSPDELHVKQAWTAVKTGLHTLVDKPLITTMDDLQSFRCLVQESLKRDLVLTSCHPKRFDPPWVWLAKNLHVYDEELGKIIGLDFDFSYENAGPPRGVRRFYGSFLIHHVSHEVDLMNYILGFSGFKARVLAEGRERYEVSGKRERDGITFHFRGMLSLRRQMQVETMTLRYERGTMAVQTCSNTAQCIVHFHEKDPGENVVLLPVPDKNWDIRTRSIMENFLRAIRKEAPSYLTPEDLLMSAEVGPLLSMNADTPSII